MPYKLSRVGCCLVSLLISLLAESSLANSSLTYEQALKMGLEQSPVVQKAKSQLNEAEWKTTEAKSTYWPTLSGSVNYLFSKKYLLTDVDFGNGSPVTIPQVIPTTTYSLNAQYILFEGFNGMSREGAAQLNQSAAQYDFRWSQFQTQRQLALMYFKAVAARMLEQVAKQNLKTLEDHRRDTSLFKKAGLSTNYDLLRVEVQVSESQAELLNSQDNIENSLGRLAEAMGIDQVESVSGDLPVPELKWIKNVSEQIKTNRSDIEALNDRSLAAQKNSTAASATWWPKISLVGQYMSYNNQNDKYIDAGRFRDAYQAGVNLTWSFFDGFSSIAKIHQAKEQQIQVEKTKQQSLLKAVQDIRYWKRKFIYFCSVYRSRLSDVEKAKESVRLAKEGRRVGARTNTDLLDAETELFRAQAGIVNAQYGAVEATINLELATGQKLLE